MTSPVISTISHMHSQWSYLVRDPLAIHTRIDKVYKHEYLIIIIVQRVFVLNNLQNAFIFAIVFFCKQKYKW